MDCPSPELLSFGRHGREFSEIKGLLSLAETRDAFRRVPVFSTSRLKARCTRQLPRPAPGPPLPAGLSFFEAQREGPRRLRSLRACEPESHAPERVHLLRERCRRQ